MTELLAMHQTNHIDDANLAYGEAQDQMALLPNYYAWIARRFRDVTRGTVLDLGCGQGAVIGHYLSHCERVIAVDVNLELLRLVSAQFDPTRVVVRQADLRGDWREISDITADVVLALDVIEHFEDDNEFVTKMKSRLKKGGSVVVKVPAQSKLYGEIDRASGHWRRYDNAQLATLFERQGFTTRSLRSMNPIGAWAYRMRRNQKTNFSKTYSRTKLRLGNLAMPLLSLLDCIPGAGGLSLVGIFDSNE